MTDKKTGAEDQTPQKNRGSEHQDRLSEVADGGGGCMETLQAASEVRGERTESSDTRKGAIRRNVLKGAAALSTLPFVSNPVAASPSNRSPQSNSPTLDDIDIKPDEHMVDALNRRAGEQVHPDPATLRDRAAAAFDEYGRDILNKVENEQVFEYSSLDAGNLRSPVDAKEYIEDMGEVSEGEFLTARYFPAAPDERGTMKVQYTTHLDSRGGPLDKQSRVSIVVDPELEDAYALATPTNDDGPKYRLTDEWVTQSVGCDGRQLYRTYTFCTAASGPGIGELPENGCYAVEISCPECSLEMVDPYFNGCGHECEFHILRCDLLFGGSPCCA